MKLISLYISSFGKFNNYSYEFNSSMNSIYEENGWGKTTITVFIKAMLYGLENREERIKYTPWNNLNGFGGTLTIEVNKEEYRIERQFNSEYPNLDTFKIYDLKDNKLSKKFGKNVGELFLNLNEQSFERSVFIPQKDLENSGFGADIEKRLSKLIGGTNDTKSYEDAIDILSTKAKRLKQGNEGLIFDLKKEHESLLEDIEECENKMKGIEVINENISSIDESIEVLIDQKKEAQEKIQEYHENQDKLTKLARANTYREEIDGIKRELEGNNYIFNNNIPSDEEVSSYRVKNRELMALLQEEDFRRRNSTTSQKLEKLKEESNFKSSIPTAEELKEIDRLVNKHQSIKGVIKTHEVAKPQKKKYTLPIILTVTFGILLLIGVALLVQFFITNKYKALMGVGIALMSVSFIGLLIGFVLFFIYSQKNTDVSYGKVKTYDFEMKEIEEHLREFFIKYHIYSNDYSNNLFIIKSNYQKYNELLKEYNNENSIAKENLSIIDTLNKDIDTFLSKFNTTAQTNEEKIGELRTHLRRSKEITLNLVTKETNLEQYIKENDLDGFVDKKIDINKYNSLIENIDEKIQDLNKLKTQNSNRIVEFETDIAKYDDLLRKNELLSKEILEKEKEYDTINLTIEYLKEAEETLLDRYISPMRDSVNKYIKLFLSQAEQTYHLDANLKFQFVTDNGLKALDSYSRGYQTIIELCLRLALIDVLYPNEKPFIIFDDPFVNFDDARLNQSKSLLKTISKTYQVIYYTCHESRKIK